jgi:ABC-type Zn2+ transport system substrate-binding protein/surface adhesin
MYGILAEKLPYIQSYTVYIYGYGQPYTHTHTHKHTTHTHTHTKAHTHTHKHTHTHTSTHTHHFVAAHTVLVQQLSDLCLHSVASLLCHERVANRGTMFAGAFEWTPNNSNMFCKIAEV